VTVYVDTLYEYPDCTLRYKVWCHMVTDGPIEELHALAARLGLRRSWFQPGTAHPFPHYDLTPNKRALALRLGATSITTIELIRFCRPSMLGGVAHDNNK